jgi:hypothetical protein
MWHLERMPHFVIRAEPADASVARATSYHERLLYMRRGQSLYQSH